MKFNEKIQTINEKVKKHSKYKSILSELGHLQKLFKYLLKIAKVGNETLFCGFTFIEDKAYVVIRT